VDTSGFADSTETRGEADTSGESPVVFDVGGDNDAPPVRPPCRETNGAMVQSAIWIANSPAGTVSKIDTESLVELGRYFTGPDDLGNPSRTSVSRNGDVVVANRNGGVVMIHGDLATCPDPTNTSSGGDDVRAFPDGCVGWHTPMAYASQRPVAWTAGTFDEVTCRYEEADVWTSGANASIDVLLLDGETGVIEETVPIAGVAASYFGIYGGAVDSQNHFWGSQLGQGSLVRVDHETFEVETWSMASSGYGMTVDRNDRVWICAYDASRFDYPSQTWETANVGGQGGCAPGLGNRIWLSGVSIVGVDIDTLAVVELLDVPTYVHGISLDFEGRVWGVSLAETFAYRVDPVTGTVDTFDQLDMPYTYSDMTGTALAIVNGDL
jgi:hypothetical protein